MSQFYDQASLVMVPSGYKAGKVYSQKPLSTDGELTFTRNSNATRVVLSASGQPLVEKVRQNLLLQSNQFDTTWTLSGATLTSGQSGYDGSNDAWLLTKNAAFGRIDQTITSSGVQVYSLYAKANDSNWIYFRADYSGGVASGYFDLANGVGGSFGNTIDSDITSVGNGWYRIQIAFNQTISVVRIYPAEGNNQSGGTSGSIYIQNAQLETGDIATDWIETASAAVSVGATANTPRLNYSNGCPSLLLEPQRTNLALWSEQLDNAGWTKSLATVTANNATSPDGYTNADTISASAGTGIPQVYSSFSATAGAYTYSFFVKAGTHKNVFFASYSSNAFGPSFTYRDMIFNTDSGTVTSSAGNLTVSTNVNNYADGWYRVSVTYTATASGSIVFIVGLASDSTTVSGTWTGSENIQAYGMQVEAGSYASSYIGPTLGASVTRLADAAYKTGISSLIGQTEGTLFVDITTTDDITTVSPIAISDGSGSNRVLIYIITETFIATVTAGGSTQAFFTSSTISPNTRYKAALAYKANDFAFYINGEQVGTDTSGTVPLCSKFGFDNGSGGILFQGLNNQVLLFKTRLTNAQLAELTTL